MIFALIFGLLVHNTDIPNIYHSEPPKFQVSERVRYIELGGKKLTVEIADTEELRAQGLMNRYHLSQNKGMLFIFNEPQILTFWMKNTKIPLSIAFFDEKKNLINLIDMSPPSLHTNTYPSYQSKKAALYALEVNQGWFKENEIEPPMKFSFLDSLYSLQ